MYTFEHNLEAAQFSYTAHKDNGYSPRALSVKKCMTYARLDSFLDLNFSEMQTWTLIDDRLQQPGLKTRHIIRRHHN